MSRQTIAAYDLPDRVAAYDADMELMHPNRWKMVDIALGMIPHEPSAPLSVIDLGIGTGFFCQRFLERFPAGTVLGIDGAASMMELARERLGPAASRVQFAIGDFRNLKALASGRPPADAVFTSFAFHHLNADEKRQIIRDIVQLLKPCGWFINADIVRPDSEAADRRIQQLRVDGIVHRSAGRDPRFVNASSTRQYLDAMEAKDGDQPQTLDQDLEIARQAGLEWVEVFWKEFREVVYGGPRAH